MYYASLIFSSETLPHRSICMVIKCKNFYKEFISASKFWYKTTPTGQKFLPHCSLIKGQIKITKLYNLRAFKNTLKSYFCTALFTKWLTVKSLLKIITSCWYACLVCLRATTAEQSKKRIFCNFLQGTVERVNIWHPQQKKLFMW